MKRRQFLPLFASLAASALVASCGGGISIGWSDWDDWDDDHLPLEHVPVDALGPVEGGMRIFRDRAAWEAFWNAHPHPQQPSRRIPDVDFDRSAVAAVFAGPKGRCNRLDIVHARRNFEAVTVRYRISSFGAGTPSSCIGNDPFVLNLADMILIPREPQQVRFEVLGND